MLRLLLIDHEFIRDKRYITSNVKEKGTKLGGQGI